ncbi:MAG: hypothetical protein DMG78_27485 [Acidobacteria bacterium]|nr:MAG: hypothetical protein DMG78_27485 [Acidobacteriota bacterium]
MKSMKQVRRSVTLPGKLAEQVERIARKKRLSDNRVLVELLEQGLEAQKEKEKAFFEVAERFRAASDPDEIKQLGDKMGRFIFGE